MTVIYLLIFTSILALIIFGSLLYWAIKNKQFEDLEKHGYDIFLKEKSKLEKDDN